jgi:hypothetical protein
MAQPVLVRAFSTGKPTPSGSPSARGPVLPPISAFAFADILRAADGPDLQAAIDGIAEICSKNRMSLAEEYASHMPPVGEIKTNRPGTAQARAMQAAKPSGGRVLESVAEGGSSSSSEGSGRRGIFGFGRKQNVKSESVRVIRVGKMGRTVSAVCTTALSWPGKDTEPLTQGTGSTFRRTQVNEASTSLQRLLASHRAI